MLRANTLVDPPGSTASAVRLSAMPAAISLSVPSPAEGDDHVDAPAGRVLGEAGGVAPPAGLHDLHVVALRQHLVHHDGVAGRDRGGEGVDDEEQPHEAIDGTTGLSGLCCLARVVTRR